MLRFITSLAASVSILFAIVASSSATSAPSHSPAVLAEAPGITLTLG